jgi:hypothetical protein
LGALLSRGTSMSDEDEPAPSPSAAVVARRASRIAKKGIEGWEGGAVSGKGESAHNTDVR